MSNPIEVKKTNQVDDVLQGYLDQLLVTATSTPTIVSAEVNSAPQVQEVVSTDTAERAARSHIAAEVRTGEVNIRRISAIADAEPVELPPGLMMTPVSIVQPDSSEIVDTAISEDVIALSRVDALSTTTEYDVQEAASATQDESGLPMASPDWRSAQGVECLIFKVAGLKLAIPLSVLGGVHNASDKITPLFGQADWSLGVWQSDEQKLTIVDSAALIMPERKINLAADGYSFVIQLDRSPWALACQEICDTVTLVHDSIKWRGEQSKRPWLAGTVIAEMCALIDVPNLLGMLGENTRP